MASVHIKDSDKKFVRLYRLLKEAVGCLELMLSLSCDKSGFEMEHMSKYCSVYSTLSDTF